MIDTLTHGTAGLWLLGGTALFFSLIIIVWLFQTKSQLNHLRMLLQESSEATTRLVEQTGRDLFIIRNTIKRMKNEKVFTGEMTMREVLDADQRVRKYIARHRKSGIIRMEFDLDKTLQETAKIYDLDLQPLLDDLNKLE